MELIMIDQTKLKIMLTPPDMDHYALRPDKLEHMERTDPSTRAAFRHIFDDAEAQTGFHTSGERLLVQMFTSKCGGCEIFLTRLSEPPAYLTSPEMPPSALTAGEEALIRRVLSGCDEEENLWEGGEALETHENQHPTSHSFKGGDVPLRRVILSLDSLDALLAVCARLRRMGYEEKSDAYIDEEQRKITYHLYLKVPDGIFYQLPESYAFLKEYGSVSRSKYSELYLMEHGRLMRGSDAVSVLGAL